MINIIRSILIIICILISPIYGDEIKKSINIAILPCTDIVMTFKKFYPLATYLEQKTGLSIKLVVPDDMTKFETFIRNGEIDFALQDPHTFLKLANLFDSSSHIRALNIEGGTTQSGVVIVRKDCGIKQLTDLKGKTVMFGPKFSASKWLAARLLFEKSGINIEKDLQAYFNGGCCEDIAFNVYLKAVDAGVVCKHFPGEHIEKQKDLGIDASQIVIIGKTIEVPMKVFSARKDVNEDIINKINQLLLALDRNNPDHVKILYPAELGGFQILSDSDFESIKIIMGTKTK